MDNRQQIKKLAYSMLDKNDIDGMRSLIQKNQWLLDCSFAFGATLLHEACWNDQTQMVELLLSLGADINSKGSFHQSSGGSENYTPLRWSINHIGLNTLKVLIRHHADLDFGGPLYWAYVKDNHKGHELAKALIKAGASSRADEVLKQAVLDGDEEIVDLLLAQPFSPKLVNPRGQSLLMLSANVSSDERHYRIAEKLLMHDASLNTPDVNGSTPLHWAVSSRFRFDGNPNIKLAKLYLDNGAKINAPDQEGVTPLLRAMSTGELPMVQLILPRAKKADLDHQDNNGSTILHHAAENSRAGVLPWVLTHTNVNYNARNKLGWTPLHVACHHLKYDNICALINAGADPNLITNEGQSALTLLKDTNFKSENLDQCIKLLKNARQQKNLDTPSIKSEKSPDLTFPAKQESEYAPEKTNYIVGKSSNTGFFHKILHKIENKVINHHTTKNAVDQVLWHAAKRS